MANLLALSDERPIFIFSESMNMKFGLPGLVKKIEGEHGFKPFSSSIYVFVSKDFSRIKIVWWDRTGYAMFYKHVPARLFRVEWKGGYKRLTGVQVKELLTQKQIEKEN